VPGSHAAPRGWMGLGHGVRPPLPAG
jgi:hypothetical protein